MKQLLNNILSVLLWRPARYRAFRHDAQIALSLGLGTTAVGLWLFGASALFVVGFAYLVALVTFPCKILLAENVPPAALATESVFARGMFAGSVCTWPVGLALAAGLPVVLIIGVAVHAAFQVWMQVLPLEEFSGARFAAPGAALTALRTPELVNPRFTRAGPPIGTFEGREIASWMLDQDGVYHDFVGCTGDRAHYVAAPGQTVLGSGLVYQARGPAPPAPLDSQDPA